jgi:hypothetical protein
MGENSLNHPNHSMDENSANLVTLAPSQQVENQISSQHPKNATDFFAESSQQKTWDERKIFLINYRKNLDEHFAEEDATGFHCMVCRENLTEKLKNCAKTYI